MTDIGAPLPPQGPSPGIVTEPFARNEALWQQGLDNYQPSLRSVLGATVDDVMSTGPMARLGRMYGRAASELGGPIGFEGSTVDLPKPPMLTAQDANERFGIDGHLKFDTDTPSPVAQELYDLKRAELARADIARRAPGGLVQGAAQLGTGLVVSALDPLNVASAFLPVVGEARMATWLARAGESVIARAGVRAGAGAVEGVAGQALVTPIVYAGARQEQADYHMVDALLDLAVGGVMGAGLHVGVGALTDKFKPRLTAAKGEAAPSLPEMIAAAPIETREAAMRAAVGQMVATGQVDNIEAVLRAEASRLNREQLMTSSAIPGQVPPPRIDFALPPDTPVRGGQRAATARPLDLFEFLAAHGGLAPSGEATALGLDKTFVPGHGRLVRQAGLPLDEARARAEEAGYIGGGHSSEQRGTDYQTTDLNHLLDALDRHARGDKVYSLNDLDAVHEHGMKQRIAAEHDREAEALRDVHATAKEHGLTLTDDEARELGELVRQGHDPLDAMSDIVEKNSMLTEHAAAAHAKEKGHGNGFDIPYERSAERGTEQAPEVARQQPARAEPGAAEGDAAPGGEPREAGAASEEAGRGPGAGREAGGETVTLDDHPALAPALAALRESEADLEALKAAGLLKDDAPELAMLEAEHAQAEIAARGYEAAGACLQRNG